MARTQQKRIGQLGYYQTGRTDRSIFEKHFMPSGEHGITLLFTNKKQDKIPKKEATFLEFDDKLNCWVVYCRSANDLRKLDVKFLLAQLNHVDVEEITFL